MKISKKGCLMKISQHFKIEFNFTAERIKRGFEAFLRKYESKKHLQNKSHKPLWLMVNGNFTFNGLIFI